jgi:protein-L-isoaspartate(D-aspartate) O-methyltransferase
MKGERAARELSSRGTLREFAYEDAPLPIAEGQTISQPYIVAMMTEALELQGGEKVLEIGTGSGYAAAILSRIAKDVYTVERIGQLAEKSAATLAELGYHNVHVLHGDGTRGWPDHAPYDAIVVAAGGPQVPESLKAQLKIGGRLVIPVGADRRLQELVRVTRVSEHEYTTEELADVRFVPLVGAEGWTAQGQRPAKALDGTLAQAIAGSSEKFTAIDTVKLGPMLKRIGDARVVLLGEATHGTSEFYRMRERISRELIQHHGFSFVAIEGDWPDAARIDHYVRHREYPPSEWTAFARFPVWMWRNREVREFVDWLRSHNGRLDAGRQGGFLRTRSLQLVQLDSIGPELPRSRRPEDRGSGTPTLRMPDSVAVGPDGLWPRDVDRQYRTCEPEVTSMLTDLMQKRRAYAEHDGARFLDACRTPGWSPTRSAIIGSCTTARALPGTCATATCSKP